MSRPFFIIFIILTLTFVLHGLSIAQKAKPVGGRMVVCVVQLEHADAEYLASILKPFLSPEGSFVRNDKRYYQGQATRSRYVDKTY